eukprot:600963-Rhodomonas_salina.1
MPAGGAFAPLVLALHGFLLPLVSGHRPLGLMGPGFRVPGVQHRVRLQNGRLDGEGGGTDGHGDGAAAHIRAGQATCDVVAVHAVHALRHRLHERVQDSSFPGGRGRERDGARVLLSAPQAEWSVVGQDGSLPQR